MSEKPKASTSDQQVGFECALEVTELLNCVAAKRYNELKCVPLLKALRACIEKKVSRSASPLCHPSVCSRCSALCFTGASNMPYACAESG